WSLERYIFYNGYPGVASLIRDEQRWRRYILDSLIETTIARDVLLQTRGDKPGMLRGLFELGCRYSGQRAWAWSVVCRSTPVKQFDSGEPAQSFRSSTRR